MSLGIRSNRLVPMIAVATASAAFAEAAQATPVLPDATYYEDVVSGFSLFPGTVINNGPNNSSTASTSTGLDVSIAGAGAVAAQGGAEAYIVYFFEAYNPNGSTAPVPLSINAYGYAGGSNATVQEYIYSEPNTSSQTTLLSWQADNNAQAGFQTASWTLAGNTVGFLELYVTGGSQFGAFGYTGYLDPTISIDPTFLAENPGFTVLLSPGLTPGLPGPVPLLPSGWLMLSGLGGLVLLGRNRRALPAL